MRFGYLPPAGRPINPIKEDSMEKEKPPHGQTDSTSADPICSLVSTIVAECEVVMGSPERVQDASSQ
jgi:hypothetical protein